MTAHHPVCRQDIRVQQEDFDLEHEMRKITALK